ncbi:ubiquinone/menaquinone biosynthesis C-methylase UbiE [Cytobacillus oceanisediminis]|uniref:Ubiquinone/menaquinone biosynthesis C-methylase UbiE n=1 Tax=Cytobacillus oceanisediminis TaxID=665099 RepID=A0A2V2ZKW4_9BACI|nr:class I SAM-dependent methyltransferase [Cytobacillus oceanisediminis]PWW20304.1 ubiquinone/menaquinone biosynthesis C-methylase UbiE [Cytobacillus oceanisediminis]
MEKFQNTKDNWDANLYDIKHSFVSKYGNNLVELLAPKQGEKILDLGCGTGDLANTLYECGVEIVGVDKSENMVKQAVSKYPYIPFMVQDATNLEYHSEFDAVFSNATLHWVQPPIQALHSIYQSLKQGGRVVAEFGGKGNVQTITDEIIQQIKEAGLEFKKEQFPWFYPSIAEYSNLMEEVGFRVTFVQHFDRPTQLDGDNGLKNWINMFGSHLLDGIPEHTANEIVTNVEKNLKGTLYKGGNWIADYKRIRVIGVK